MASEIIEKTKAPLLKRAEELRPMVDEYNEIQNVLAALGDSAPSPRARATASAKPSGNGARRPRPRSGGRKDEVVKLVTSKPGLTIPEMAKQMGIKDNYLYRVTSGLVAEGVLRKDGQGFVPAK